MTDAQHFGFVIAAYAIAAAVVIGMISAIWLDYRRQIAALRRLESLNERSNS